MSAKQARLIPYANRTLPRILSYQAGRHGDKVLVASASRSITYAGAPDIAARSAGRLAAAAR